MIRRTSAVRLWGAFLTLFMLSSCAAPAPQMSDPATRATLIAGAATVTPQPWETPATAIPPRLPTPNLPMATPYATPRPQSNFFEVVELGFRIDHPFHWARSSGAVPGTLMQLANQPNNVFVLILRSPMDGADLETSASEMHSRVADWLGGLEERSSAPVEIKPELGGWRSEFWRSYPQYGVAVESLVVSVVQGKQLITLAAYAKDVDLALERQTVEAIFGSITLVEPTVFGLPRSESYVYAEQAAVQERVYDPANGIGDRRVFSGLVGLNVEQQIHGELAESWSISADGTVYTFHLRPEARFHDGRPVTAQDVVYSWERALAPETRSNLALTYLGDVVGGRERASGEAETIAGLRVLDSRTLEVTIDGPKPYFLLKLTAPPAMVVDQANVQQGERWYRRPNGTGPYRLLSWESGKAKLYERFDGFYGEVPPTRFLVGRLDVGYSGTYLYRLGELDQLQLNWYDMGIVSDPESELGADLRSAVPLCTAYVAFDTSRPPFDDPNVRRAFALAVDGQQYEERAMTDGSLRARGLLPPGMPGFGEAVRGVSFDPEAARAQLAQSPYANGELPPIKLTTSGYGFYLDPGVGVLVQMWQETLGATITIDQLEPGGFAETWRGSERGQLFFHEWCADYPDPENMLDALFHSESQQNIGRYGNPDLDSLLERARVEADVSERLSLYGEAEQLLLDDAAAVVLSHRVQTMLVEPRVSGVVAAPGHVAVERYLKLEPAQDE